MTHRAMLTWIIVIGVALFTAGRSGAAQTAATPQAQAVSAVRSFYTFHLAHNKAFTLRNIQQRKRFLTADLYELLVGEIKRQAEYSKTHKDEAPEFEGDPLTDSQEYPNSFRVGTADGSGDLVKVTVTFIWKGKTSRETDKRDIVVEMIRSGQAWLINDVVNHEGTSLRADLKKSH